MSLPHSFLLPLAALLLLFEPLQSDPVRRDSPFSASLSLLLWNSAQRKLATMVSPDTIRTVIGIIGESSISPLPARICIHDRRTRASETNGASGCGRWVMWGALVCFLVTAFLFRTVVFRPRLLKLDFPRKAFPPRSTCMSSSQALFLRQY
jgi:hypothetical protein